jgi:hypothetical protein
MRSMHEEQHRGNTSVEIGQLQHDQYVLIMRKVSKALLKDWNSEDATMIAEDDWEEDRKGFTFLDGERFKDGLFEV